MKKGGRWKDPVQPGAFTLVCIFVGVVLHIVALRFANWQLPAIPGREQPVSATFELVSAGQSWSELFDSAPLFVPTARNFASTLSGIASLTEELELFNPHGPLLQGRTLLSAQQAQLLGAEFVNQPIDMDALLAWSAPGWRPAAVVPAVVSGPQEHLPAVFVIASVRKDGNPLLLQPPSENLLSSLPTGLWSPAEWWIQMEPTGMVGQALQISGTGDPALDTVIRNELQAQAHFWNLPAGYFRVQFVPN